MRIAEDNTYSKLTQVIKKPKCLLKSREHPSRYKESADKPDTSSASNHSLPNLYTTKELELRLDAELCAPLSYAYK